MESYNDNAIHSIGDNQINAFSLVSSFGGSYINECNAKVYRENNIESLLSNGYIHIIFWVAKTISIADVVYLKGEIEAKKLKDDMETCQEIDTMAANYEAQKKKSMEQIDSDNMFNSTNFIEPEGSHYILNMDTMFFHKGEYQEQRITSNNFNERNNQP